MARTVQHIALQALASDLAGIFDRLTDEGASIVVERDGQPIALVTPLSPVQRARRRRQPLSPPMDIPGPTFTLETAAGSVAPVSAPDDWQEVERRAKEERVARVMRKMREQ